MSHRLLSLTLLGGLCAILSSTPARAQNQLGGDGDSEQVAGIGGGDLGGGPITPIGGIGGGGTSSCQIARSATCATHPDLGRQFADTWDGADKNAARCAQRAAEYGVWCGDAGNDTTQAFFIPADGNAAPPTVYTAVSSCIIRQSACVTNPSLTGAFVDDYQGAGHNAARCAARAREYSDYCQNPSNVATSATFTDAAHRASTTAYATPPNSCRITRNRACRNSPSLPLSFEDAYQNSNNDPSRCAARAREYAVACGDLAGASTTASFSTRGVTQRQETYTAPCGLLPAGTVLRANESISSCGGRYVFVEQGDGNLVLYKSSGQALWASNTWNAPGGYVALQGDGNLVVYDANRPRFDTKTFGHPGSLLAVQDDGNVVIYAPNWQALWSTRTAGR